MNKQLETQLTFKGLVLFRDILWDAEDYLTAEGAIARRLWGTDLGDPTAEARRLELDPYTAIYAYHSQPGVVELHSTPSPFCYYNDPVFWDGPENLKRAVRNHTNIWTMDEGDGIFRNEPHVYTIRLGLRDLTGMLCAPGQKSFTADMAHFDLVHSKRRTVSV